MWRILKAEFSYHRIFVIIAFSIHLLLLTFFSVTSFMKGSVEHDAIPGIIFLMGDITVVAAVFVILSRVKAVGRFHVLLPVSVNTIGFSRILFVVIFWIALVTIMCFTLLTLKMKTLEIQHNNFVSILPYEILAYTGFILILNANYLISRDIGHCIRRKYTIFTIADNHIPGILLSLVYAVITLTVANIRMNSIEPACTIILSAVLSPAGAVSLLTGGVLMSYLSVFVFVKRKSYLQ